MERIDWFVPFIRCLFYSWEQRQSGMLLLGLLVEFPTAAGLTRLWDYVHSNWKWAILMRIQTNRKFCKTSQVLQKVRKYKITYLLHPCLNYVLSETKGNITDIFTSLLQNGYSTPAGVWSISATQLLILQRFLDVKTITYCWTISCFGAKSLHRLECPRHSESHLPCVLLSVCFQLLSNGWWIINTTLIRASDTTFCNMM